MRRLLSASAHGAFTARLTALAIVAASLALTGPAAATGLAAGARAAADATVAHANPPVVFAHTKSDLAADPGARFGKLPNGMSYVIYQNKTPPGAASVWMRVGAGSVMEQENQRGLAHFIEHMAFNGSKNVPRGEMIKILQRDGLQFGADTNAQTEFFQTVYKLNLPRATAPIVSDALFLMRETAGNVSFNPDAIDSERGVVLGEERARATVASAAYEEQMKLLLSGSTFAERMPIGKVEVLKTAQRPVFQQFYNDFYRPEYTTLIVAGDVDPKKVEAEIRRRFSDWKPAPPSSAALTSYGTVQAGQVPEVKVYAADGLVGMLSVSWVKPPVDAIETKATDFAGLQVQINNSILNERLSRAASAPDAAFLAAGIQRDDIQRTARLHSLGIQPKDGQDQAALAQALTLYSEYVANGPTQVEFDRAMTRLEQELRDAKASARTVPTQAIAAQIVAAVSSQNVLQSAAQALDEFEELKPRFTVAGLQAALKASDLGEPSLLWRQAAQAGSFDEPAMLAAYSAAMAKPVGAAAARQTVQWPYGQFGKASAVVSQVSLRDLAATRVTFANGVVVTVKPTKFEERGVTVAVQIGNGKLGLRAEQGAALFMASQLAPLQVGGLGKLSRDDLGEVLAGKAVGLNVSIGPNSTILSGNSTSADFPLEMQLLTAFITDPGLRPDALDRIKASLPSSFDSARTSPDGVYALKASGDVYGNDPRFSTPTLQDALGVSHESIVGLVKDQLAHGPVDVTVVGDVSPEEVIRAVGPTLGALPPLQPAVMAPGADQLHFPTSDLRRVYTHDGRVDQNLSVIAWPTTDQYADPQRTAGLEVLAAVLTIRELEEVRQKQGASYSASASSAPARHFPGFGYLVSRATVRPEVDDTYFKTVSDIAEGLKQTPVSADELTRARLPMIDHLRNAKNSNQYWLGLLAGTARDPNRLAIDAAAERNLLAVTPQDIQALAATYLDMFKALRIQVKPKDAAAPKN